MGSRFILASIFFLGCGSSGESDSATGQGGAVTGATSTRASSAMTTGAGASSSVSTSTSTGGSGGGATCTMVDDKAEVVIGAATTSDEYALALPAITSS